MELLGIMAIALYGALWSLMHSLLASDGAKAMVRGVFGRSADRWYRLAYNGLALVTLVPTELMASQFPDHVLYVLPQGWYQLVLAGRIAALAGVVYAIFFTGIWDMSGLRQIGWAQGRGGSEEHDLVTTGIYGWVRHPLYLFALGLFWLAPQMTIYQLALYLVFTVYLYAGTFPEERRLVAEFGNAYLEYRQRVPRLLPVRRRRAQHEEVEDLGLHDS